MTIRLQSKKVPQWSGLEPVFLAKETTVKNKLGEKSMGVLDKFLNVMKLNTDDEHDFYDDDFYDYEKMKNR